MVADLGGSLSASRYTCAFDADSRQRGIKNDLLDHSAGVGVCCLERHTCRHERSEETDLLTTLLEGAVVDAAGIARSMMKEWGSLGAILTSSRSRQSSLHVDVRVSNRLVCLRKAVFSITRARIAEHPIIRSSSAVIDFLQARMRFEPIEQVMVLFLDPRNRLISNEVLWDGTAEEVPLHIGRLFHRAIDLGAHAILLAHNHPTGDPTPSVADEALTRRVAEAGRVLGIRLIDHVIVARGGFTSLRARGLL